MTAARIVWLYLLTVVVFFAIDLVWIGAVARGLYSRELAGLLRPDIRWGAALLFYLLYIAGILILVVLPAVDKGSLADAAWRGALLGLIAYATYDLTNYSTLKDWSLTVTIVDLIWGALLTGAVSAASYGIGGWLANR